jgi:quercetin dioxygenase-like cupin family protein
MQVPQVTRSAVVPLLHLYTDDNGDTHFGTTEFVLTVQDFAPPAAPFNASDGQPASRFVIIKLPVGWVGEPHTSPKPQVLFCLSGSLKVTCSTGQAMVIEAGMGLVMSDVTGRATKAKSPPPSP